MLLLTPSRCIALPALQALSARFLAPRPPQPMVNATIGTGSFAPSRGTGSMWTPVQLPANQESAGDHRNGWAVVCEVARNTPRYMKPSIRSGSGCPSPKTGPPRCTWRDPSPFGVQTDTTGPRSWPAPPRPLPNPRHCGPTGRVARRKSGWIRWNHAPHVGGPCRRAHLVRRLAGMQSVTLQAATATVPDDREGPWTDTQS